MLKSNLKATREQLIKIEEANASKDVLLGLEQIFRDNLRGQDKTISVLLGGTGSGKTSGIIKNMLTIANRVVEEENNKIDNALPGHAINEKVEPFTNDKVWMKTSRKGTQEQTVNNKEYATESIDHFELDFEDLPDNLRLAEEELNKADVSIKDYMKVMTYHKTGRYLADGKTIAKEKMPRVIFLDEIHSFLLECKFAGVLAFVWDWINEILGTGVIVIGLTATPEPIYEIIEEKELLEAETPDLKIPNFKFYNEYNGNRLFVENTYFTNLSPITIRKMLPEGAKTLSVLRYLKECREMAEEFPKTCAICSASNEDEINHPETGEAIKFSDYCKEDREHMIRTSTYPEGIDHVASTSVFKEGFNIDPSVGVEYIITNFYDYPTIAQIKGRARNNLKAFIVCMPQNIKSEYDLINKKGLEAQEVAETYRMYNELLAKDLTDMSEKIKFANAFATLEKYKYKNSFNSKKIMPYIYYRMYNELLAKDLTDMSEKIKFANAFATLEKYKYKNSFNSKKIMPYIYSKATEEGVYKFNSFGMIGLRLEHYNVRRLFEDREKWQEQMKERCQRWTRGEVVFQHYNESDIKLINVDTYRRTIILFEDREKWQEQMKERCQRWTRGEVVFQHYNESDIKLINVDTYRRTIIDKYLNKPLFSNSELQKALIEELAQTGLKGTNTRGGNITMRLVGEEVKRLGYTVETKNRKNDEGEWKKAKIISK